MVGASVISSSGIGSRPEPAPIERKEPRWRPGRSCCFLPWCSKPEPLLPSDLELPLELPLRSEEVN